MSRVDALHSAMNTMPYLLYVVGVDLFPSPGLFKQKRLYNSYQAHHPKRLVSHLRVKLINLQNHVTNKVIARSIFCMEFALTASERRYHRSETVRILECEFLVLC